MLVGMQPRRLRTESMALATNQSVTDALKLSTVPVLVPFADSSTPTYAPTTLSKALEPDAPLKLPRRSRSPLSLEQQPGTVKWHEGGTL